MRGFGCGFGEELFAIPTTAERFDKLNSRDQSLTRQLGVGPFSLERGAIGIDYLDIRNNPGTIPLSRQVRCPSRIKDSAFLGH